jgi:UDP-N-acetylmuramoyl-tripeptide--D-alanyl-D-alanine ligase
MMLFSLSELSSTLGADLRGDGGVVPTSVCLDSRSVEPGACFVALRLARDGHEYAAMAVEGGASCLLVDHEMGLGVPQLVAPDTLRALQSWGEARLRSCRPPNGFGVTGSAGKTSTKELLACAVSGWKSPGNRNNTLGLPAALAMLPDGTKAAVLEMGMSSKGEIKRLTEMAPPDFGVITNVGMAHLENFKKQEGIAEAKGELVAGLVHGGAWVFPKDDPWCRWISQQAWAAKTKPVAVGKGADFSVASTESLGPWGERFSLSSPMGALDIAINLTGGHHVQNAALAASIALIAGFDASDVVIGLASAQPEEGRGRLSPLVGGGWLLDESYNASPDSVVSCARALMRLDGGEPVAVLGCIRELGPDSAPMHAATGKVLRRAGISRVWIYGDFAADFCEGFGQGATAYPDFETMEPALAELPQGARILVKGSRYWKSERAVAFLLRIFGLNLGRADIGLAGEGGHE